MPVAERVLDTGEIRLWDTDDPQAHLVSASRLASVVEGLQKAVRLLAAQEEGLTVGRRFRPPVVFNQHYTLMLGVPAEGSYSQPLQVMDLRDEYTLEDEPFYPLQAATLVLDSIANHDYASAQRALPNPRIRREVLSLAKEFVPHDQWTLSVSAEAHTVDLGATDITTIEEWLSLADSVVELDITGELIALKFETRTITLKYPPTGKHLEATYDIDLEEALFAKRRGLVQVSGTAILDDEACPIELQEVSAIRMVDLSPFEVTSVRHGGLVLTTRAPIPITPTLSEDSQLFLAYDADLGIDAFATSRDKLISAVQEDIAFSWECYALEEPEKLTVDAAALRLRLLRTFEVA